MVTNITEDHLGLDRINTMDDLCNVKSLVAEAVKDDGYVVINADDKWSKNIINNIKSILKRGIRIEILVWLSGG